MTLSVHESGRIIVTIPPYVSFQGAFRFVQERKRWLERALAALPAHAHQDPAERRTHYLKHRAAAHALIATRVHMLNQAYGYRYARITVRCMSSQWGSCSARGNLSFDYRLAFLPQRLCDYVIVHELCHLAEMNHSARFWRLVELTIPDQRELRKALRARTPGTYTGEHAAI